MSRTMEKNKAGEGMEKDRNSSSMFNTVVRESLTELVMKMQKIRANKHAETHGRAFRTEGRAGQWPRGWGFRNVCVGSVSWAVGEREAMRSRDVIESLSTGLIKAR